MAEPWFKKGLRFACTRCGNCCTGEPGTVRVTREESARLAERLELETHDFHRLYTRPLDGGARSLRERANGDCVLWDHEQGCTVYEDRPRQCQTWPFWGSVVESPESWATEAEDCPGMDRGPRHALEAILRSAKDDGTSSQS